MRRAPQVPLPRKVSGSPLKTPSAMACLPKSNVSGSPVNIQLRWAKIDSAASGGTDTWNMFYQVDPNATTGPQVAWQNVGIDYKFAANGQMNPATPSVTLNNVTINGVALGNVTLTHGTGGVTQFADPNGNAQVNLLQQNGFPAGELQQVSVNIV